MPPERSTHLHEPVQSESKQIQDATTPVNQQTTQPNWPKIAVAPAEKGELTKRQKSDIHPRSKAVKQLSLRIDDSTHQKISLAAQQVDKSINAWMEEVLSNAADDVLGRGSDGAIDAIQSSAIRQLIEQPEYSVRLIEGITPYLQDSSPPAIFQFSHVLRKLLIGWDRVKPLLDLEKAQFLEKGILFDPGIGSLPKLVAATLPFLQAENFASVVQFGAVIKKFLLDITAVEPFLREDKVENIIKVVMAIEELLQEIEGNPSGSQA